MNQNVMPRTKVYISYSRDDKKIVTEIIKKALSFKSFQKNKIRYNIEIIWDQSDNPEKSKDEIEWKIKSASVVVCMLSENYFNSKFNQKIELPLAIERNIDVHIGILGILIKSVNFSSTSISPYNIIPIKKGRPKPLEEWRRKEECWEIIKQGLKDCVYNSDKKFPSTPAYLNENPLYKPKEIPKKEITAKVFISYAREDSNVVKKLINNALNFKKFQQNRIRYNVKFWWDEHINPGEFWEKEIEEEMKSSDLIILVLSNNFFKSDFITNTELPEAIERNEKFNIGVIGILLDEDCQYRIPKLKPTHIIPQYKRKIKPLSKWNSKRDCYKFIKASLKICIPNSIKRSPDTFKYKPEEISGQLDRLYKEQFLGERLHKLDRLIKRKKGRAKNNKSKKKKNNNFLKFLMLMILIFALYLILLRTDLL